MYEIKNNLLFKKIENIIFVKISGFENNLTLDSKTSTMEIVNLQIISIQKKSQIIIILNI